MYPCWVGSGWSRTAWIFLHLKHSGPSPGLILIRHRGLHVCFRTFVSSRISSYSDKPLIMPRSIRLSISSTLITSAPVVLIKSSKYRAPSGGNSALLSASTICKWGKLPTSAWYSPRPKITSCTGPMKLFSCFIWARNNALISSQTRRRMGPDCSSIPILISSWSKRFIFSQLGNISDHPSLTFHSWIGLRPGECLWFAVMVVNLWYSWYSCDAAKPLTILWLSTHSVRPVVLELRVERPSGLEVSTWNPLLITCLESPCAKALLANIS